MEAIISLVVTLTMLILLQAVLGFDNLLYISLESKRAPEADRQTVRRWGIGLAVGLRIVLLLVLIKVVGTFKQPLFNIHWAGVIEVEVNFHSLIVLLGGIFIMYTATREIFHMLSLHDLNQSTTDAGAQSSRAVIIRIVAMNLVFSFDSILSAMALTDNFWVMAAAIVVSGGLMIWLADRVAAFLQRNRMYEVLGLFVLFVVGIMLLSEGGHMAKLQLMGDEIHAMSKATFYFVITVLVLVDVVQSRYQKKILRQRESAAE
jgi:predicted tellurium resistance membrane protein TerC